VPPLPSLSKTLPMTLIDRDGTRHVFTAKTGASSLQVLSLDTATSTLVPAATGLGALLPAVLGAAVDTSKFNAVCLDVAYDAPAGVHLGLWRYVALNNTGGSTTCSQGAGTAAPVLLGYATERTDRFRNEFSWDGKLLSQLDATGNELRYAYLGGLPFAAANTALGKLNVVYEPSECTEAAALAANSTCRSFKLGYDPVYGVVTSVVDPAGRPTTYQYDTSFGFPQLSAVVNPDGTAVRYTYYDGDAATCTASGQVPQRGQLCSIDDERTDNTVKTLLRYNSSLSGQLGRLNSIVDRRGTTTTFTYAADGSSTDALVNSTQKRSWRALDSRGRAGQVVDSVGTVSYHQTTNTWDAAGCRVPDAKTDNNLCHVVGTAFNDTETGVANGVDTPDSDVTYVYNDEGGLVSESHVQDIITDLIQTYGYRAIYVQRGSTTTADDTVVGSENVTSGARPASANVVFAISDRQQYLTATGNLPNLSIWQKYLTTWRVENNPAAAPNTAPAAPVAPADPGDPVICTQSDLTVPVTNTGLLCQVETPPWDSTHTTIAKYSYDHFGAKRTFASAKAVYETPAGSTPPHTTYTYYPSGSTDQSGLTSAAGWLKGVTDPYGKFVAFGYDRAGDVTRTWDRNATSRGLVQSAANTLDTYPANSVGGYSQSLFGPYANAPLGSTAQSAPWRYALKAVDPLGNTTTYTVDEAGNVKQSRPPRGNLGNTSFYDTAQEFDAADQITSRMTAEGRQAGNQSWRWTYDAYGNLASQSDPLAHPDYPKLRTDDPNGHTKKFVYDGVNRVITEYWTRTATASQAASSCGATGGPLPLPATHYYCYRQHSYDGLDHQIGYTDGEHQTTIHHYDAMGRETSVYVPRATGVTLRTEKRYDRDSRLTQVCSPREYDSTEPNATLTTCWATGQYTTDYGYTVAGTLFDTTRHRGSTQYDYFTQYNADNVLTSTSAPGVGPTILYTVDLLGRRTDEAVRRTSTTYNHTTYAYDAVGNVTAVTKPGGRITAYSYDADNRVVDTVEGADSTDAAAAGTTSADGGSNIRSSVRYDADGNVVARLEPRAFRTAAGAPAKTVPATTSFMTRYDVDGDNRVVAEYRPRYDSSTEFGDLGTASAQSTQCSSTIRPVAVTGNPLDLPAYDPGTAVCVRRTAYDSANNITSLRLPTSNGSDNRYIGYGYTDDNLLASVGVPNPADPVGGTRTTAQSTVYDAENRPLSVTGAAPVTGGTPSVSTYTYTRDGKVAQQTAGRAANVTTFTYDANGNRKSSTDALGHTTSWTYTTDDLVQDETAPGGGKTSYTYDLLGNPTDVVAPNLQGTGLTVHNTFTIDKLLETTKEPVSSGVFRRTTYGYDTGGRKTSVLTEQLDGTGAVTANGGTQTFGYFPDDRLSTQTGRTGETVARTYDAAGNPATVTNTPVTGSAVATSYTSYLDGLTKSVTQSGRTTSYAYDGTGQLAVRDVRTGPHTYTRYGYGDAGQLTSLSSDAMPTGATVGFGYDMAGRLTSQANPNGTTVSRTYRSDNKLLTQQIAPTATPTLPITSWRYDYDAVGRVSLAGRDASSTAVCPAATATPPTLAPAGLQCFYYDTANHLDRFRDSTADKDVTYDPNGNRTRFDATTYTYSYDNEIATATDGSGTKTYQYDPAGRMTYDGSSAHCYDGLDRLLQVRVGTSDCTGTIANGVTYTYDGLDRQITRTEVGASAVNAGTSTVYYDGGAKTTLAEQAPNGATTTYVPAAGLPAYVTKSGSGGASQYLTDDGRGNVATATSSTTGTLACSLRYDPFGSPVGAQSASNACSTGSTPSSVLYGGQRRDAVSGYYQLGSRTYDPSKAAFLTPDTYRAGGSAANLSVGTDPLTANRYGYVNGDPVNLRRPVGTQAPLRRGGREHRGPRAHAPGGA
jgi:RHS repeat-associated protein